MEYRKTVITDRDAKFTTNFLTTPCKGLDIKLNFNTMYLPQTDGQTERVKQILEVMLRMYVINQQVKWRTIYI